MGFILLTGAGFSRNWGGWLANEAFEYLLGSTHIDQPIRDRLWLAKEKKQGFEDVLAELQTEYETKPYGDSEEHLRNLSNAVTAMFEDMAIGFNAIMFDDTVAKAIKLFLASFNAIYTLNQDTFLEQKYSGPPRGSKFQKLTLPGIKPANTSRATGHIRHHLWTPDDPKNFAPLDRDQPYFKLHGSYNWIDEERGSILILGGNKAANIKKYPLLVSYHDRFRADLSSAKTRLMIIGYSFNDQHINSAITDTIATTDLELFIIDPLGVDVFDKREERVSIRQPPTPLMQTLSPRVIGASRRPLLATFGADLLERGKVMKFFNP